MPGPFDRLRTDLARGFNGKVWSAVIYRPIAVVANGLDPWGDPEPNPSGNPVSGTYSVWSGQGFVDQYSDFFRKTAGIPETDSKVCIFAGSLPNGVAPQKDDKVKIKGEWWQLRRVSTDPAQALWTCQAFIGEAPRWS